MMTSTFSQTLNISARLLGRSERESILGMQGLHPRKLLGTAEPLDVRADIRMYVCAHVNSLNSRASVGVKCESPAN